MFSLPKLLLLFVIVAGVLVAYRYFGSRRAIDKERDGNAADAEAAIQDMERCPVCGDYVSAESATSCGRAECPY